MWCNMLPDFLFILKIRTGSTAKYAADLTHPKHDSFPSLWEYQSVCSVLVLCQQSEELPSVSEHRGQSVRPEASLFSDVRNHSPASDSLIPGMWSPFLLGWPTSNLSQELQTSDRHSWTPAGLRSSGEHIIIQWATSQSEPTVGFEQTQEQLTSRKKYDVAKKGGKNTPTIVSASGGADRSGRCRVDSQWLRLIDS